MVSELVLHLAAFVLACLAVMGLLSLATGALLSYAARRHGIAEHEFLRGE